MKKETIIDIIKEGDFKDFDLPNDKKLSNNLFIKDRYGNKFYVMGVAEPINGKVTLQASSTPHGDARRVSILADYFDESALTTALATLLIIKHTILYPIDAIKYIFDILWGNESEYVFCVGERDLREYLNPKERYLDYSHQLALYFYRTQEIELCNRNDYTCYKLEYDSFLQRITKMLFTYPFDSFNIFEKDNEWILENFENILLG